MHTRYACYLNYPATAAAHAMPSAGRAQRDRRFRAAMLTEAINELLAGDLEAGKAMLRDYVNATITFDTLAEELDKPSKSLQRMLGPKGNPTAESLFGIIKALQEFEHLHLEVKATKNAA